MILTTVQVLQFSIWQPISNKCQLVKEINGDPLVDLSLLTWVVCVHISVCVWMTEWDSKRWREREEDELQCWQADGLSLCLPRSSTSQPITPASSHQLVVCHSLRSNISSPFSCSCSLSSLHACLLCWLHVKCQVQSGLTDPLWRVRGCKTSKVMSPARPLPFSHIPPLFSGAVCIGKAPACLEARRPSAVSKELLGWNPPSKDTWQPFTATRDRTSPDPTDVPTLLVSSRLCLTGYSWVAVSFIFWPDWQAESIVALEWLTC